VKSDERLMSDEVAAIEREMSDSDAALPLSSALMLGWFFIKHLSMQSARADD